MSPSTSQVLDRQRLDDLLQQALAALSAGRLDVARHNPSTPPPRPSRREFPFYQPTGHTNTELVFTDRPCTRFFLADNWSVLAPGRVLGLLPGVPHSERCLRHNVPYNLLWLTITPEAVGLHVTTYRPGRGYGLLGARLAFHPSVQGRLWDSTQELAKHDDSLSRTSFQGYLIAAVCQAARGLGHQEDAAGSYQRQVVERVQMFINDHFRDDLSIGRLAEWVHYSPSHLNKMFREHLGTPIRQYLIDTRLDHARQLLETTDRPIKQVAYDAGFNDPLYFSRLFRSRTGKSPGSWRNRRATV